MSRERRIAQWHKAIGRNIALYRRRAGLSQQELASRASISVSYLSKIEAPKSEKLCSIVVLLDIADALQVDVVALLNPEPEV